MPISIIDNFDVNTNLPIDSRSIVADVTARDAIISGRRYEGMFVFNVADKNTYQLRNGIGNGDWVVAYGPGVSSMIYPAAGIALSTGSAWGASITDNSANWNTAYSHSQAAHQVIINGTGFVKASGTTISYDNNTYLTSQISHADVVVDGDFTSQGIMLRGASAGTYSILTDNSANWNTAYSHSQAAHQVIINGTGFVKAAGTTLSYDNNSYALVANQADNRIITATGTANSLNAEANLTFDGTTLALGTGSRIKHLSGTSDKTHIQNQLTYSIDTLYTAHGLAVSILNTNATNKNATVIRADNVTSDFSANIIGSNCFLAMVYDGLAAINTGFYAHGTINSANAIRGIHINIQNSGAGAAHAIYVQSGKVRLGLSSGTPSTTVGIDSSGNLISYANPSGEGLYLPVGGGQITKNASDVGDYYHIELYSANTADANKYISLRFHQGSQYWGAIRYNANGFRLTGGADFGLTSLTAFNGTFTGNVAIGEGAGSANERLDVWWERTADIYHNVAQFRSVGACGGGARIVINAGVPTYIEANSGYSSTGFRSGSTYSDTNIVNTSTGGVYGSINFYTNDAKRMAINPDGNITVAGTLSANTVTGINVTSGVDPGHSHTTLNSMSYTRFIFGTNSSGSNFASATFDPYELSMYKSGFWDINGASWAPTTAWYWGLTIAHTSNNTSYNYAGQIIIGNGTNRIHFRHIGNGTPGRWNEIWHTGNLGVFNSSTAGYVPASGGGTTNFLRADGNWAAAGGSSDSITLTEAPGTNQTATGVKVTMTAGEALSFGQVVYFKSDGKVWKSVSGTASTTPVIGMVISAASANGSVTVLLHGIVRNDSWNWSVGYKLYLQIYSGDMVQSPPTGSGHTVQVLGVATHADRVYFNPSLDTLVNV